VFVHFPIAFATAAVVFITVGTVFKNRSWAMQCMTTGRWMLWAATISACIAGVFGWLAYNSIKHDEAGHLAMTLHRNWALAALGALILLVVLDVCSWRSVAKPAHGFLILLVLAWALVISTAWHGGEMVYRHGLGVMSLPAPDEHTHQHGEGHGHGDMSVQREATHHEDTHSHDDTANGEPPDDAESASKTLATDSVGTAPRRSGHTHASGMPPHKD
jgi:uncharacterized membrane protein